MSDHTPGPWHAAHRHGDGTAHEDVIGQLGWEVHGPPEPGPGCRGQFRKAGDAHLIAAAPDLLAALETCLKGGTSMAGIKQASAAMAKARGEGWEHDDDCWAADMTKGRP